MKQKDRKEGPSSLTCCIPQWSQEDLGFAKFAPQTAALARIFMGVPELKPYQVKSDLRSDILMTPWRGQQTHKGFQFLSFQCLILGTCIWRRISWRWGKGAWWWNCSPVSPLDSMVPVQKTPVMYNIYLDGRQGRQRGRELDAEKLQRATWWVVAQSPLFKITPFSLAFQHGAESDEEKGVLFKKITYQIVHLHAKCCCIM